MRASLGPARICEGPRGRACWPNGTFQFEVQILCAFCVDLPMPKTHKAYFFNFRCGSQCGAQILSVDLKCLECVLWLWAITVAWAMDYDFNSEVWVSDLLQVRVDFQCTLSFFFILKCGC